MKSVFISSTSEDLKLYREAVINIILSSGFHPLAMEHFGSRSKTPQEICMNEIKECDIFIGIYAFRYGFTPEKSGRSITEEEFHFARKMGKRSLCYFMLEGYYYNAKTELISTLDEPTWKKEKLQEFKDKISKDLVIQHFTSIDNLCAKISADLTRIANGDPTGYILSDVYDSWMRWYKQHLNYVFMKDLGGRNEHIHTRLEILWREFINLENWEEVIQGKLEQIYNFEYNLPFDSNDFIKCIDLLKQIDFQINYEIIQHELYPIIEQMMEICYGQLSRLRGEKFLQIKELVKNLKELKEMLENPSFHKCFLLLGSLGAGKTHFVYSLVDDTLKNKNSLLILYLRPIYEVQRIENLIMSCIAGIVNINFRNLSDVMSFMKKSNTKLVIVIEDFHKWLELDPLFQDKLVDFIALHTCIHTLYWIISIQDTYYDKVAMENKFWDKYGFKYRREYLKGESMPFIGSWINLDDLNYKDQLGLKLIFKVLKKNQFDIEQFRKRLQSQTLKNITNPFIAWLLLDLRNQIALDNMFNLTYIEFVEYFWDVRKKVLLAKLEKTTSLCFLNISSLDNILEKTVWAISDLLTQRLAWTCPMTDVLAYLKDNMKDELALLRNSCDPYNLLNVLEYGNLMRKTNYSNFPWNPPTEIIELCFIIFWEYKIANNFINSKWELLNKEPELTWRCILESLKLVESPWMEEEILEFMLLVLDKYLDEDKFYRIFDTKLLEGDTSFSALCFAGLKSNNFLRKFVTNSLLNKNTGRKLTNRELFAVLCYTGDTTIIDISTEDKLKIIQPYYQLMKDNYLEHYFLHILDTIFSSAKTYMEIFASLKYLFGCEVLGITKEIADLTVNYLTRHCPDELSFIKSVIRFLKSNHEEFHFTEPIYKEFGESYYYLECFIESCCVYVVETLEISAFDLFIESSWYKPGNYDLKYPISHWIVQKANLALGRLYQINSDIRENYLDIIQHLVYSGIKYKREIAFYLIRHSVPTRKNKAVIVHSNFYPYLEIIYNDNNLKHLKKNYKAFFDVNFHRNKIYLDEYL